MRILPNNRLHIWSESSHARYPSFVPEGEAEDSLRRLGKCETLPASTSHGFDRRAPQRRIAPSAMQFCFSSDYPKALLLSPSDQSSSAPNGLVSPTAKCLDTGLDGLRHSDWRISGPARHPVACFEPPQEAYPCLSPDTLPVPRSIREAAFISASMSSKAFPIRSAGCRPYIFKKSISREMLCSMPFALPGCTQAPRGHGISPRLAFLISL